MLQWLADWFYDPVVFWGTPFVLLGAWTAMKWVRGWLRRREPRR